MAWLILFLCSFPQAQRAPVPDAGQQKEKEKLLREVGYQVRGGGCRVHGQEMVFLDRDLPLSERVEILLDELSRRDVHEDLLSPSLRRLLTGGATP